MKLEIVVTSRFQNERVQAKVGDLWFSQQLLQPCRQVRPQKVRVLSPLTHEKRFGAGN